MTNLKLKSSHPQNIWNDDIDDDIGDTHFLIPITDTLINENMIWKMISSFNHAIHSILKHKFLKICDGFTILSNSMMMDE